MPSLQLPRFPPSQENEVAKTILDVNWGFIALVAFIVGLFLRGRTTINSELCPPTTITVDVLPDDTPAFV